MTERCEEEEFGGWETQVKENFPSWREGKVMDKEETKNGGEGQTSRRLNKYEDTEVIWGDPTKSWENQEGKHAGSFCLFVC